MTSRSCTRKRDERRCVGSLDEGVRETSEMLRSQNDKVPDTRHFFSPLASFSFPLSPSCLLPLLIPSLFIFLNYFSFSLCLFTNTHKLGRIHDIIAQSCDANERTTIDDNWSPFSWRLLLLLIDLKATRRYFHFLTFRVSST